MRLGIFGLQRSIFWHNKPVQQVCVVRSKEPEKPKDAPPPAKPRFTRDEIVDCVHGALICAALPAIATPWLFIGFVVAITVASSVALAALDYYKERKHA